MRVLKGCGVEMLIIDEADRLKPKTFAEVRDIAILNELKTRYILLQLGKIEFLVSSKELEQPLNNRKRFAQMPEFSQKVLCL